MGPSFPRQSPAATANMMDTDLMRNVHLPRYPRMMNPQRIVLIAGIPDPHAYGANIRTRLAASEAKPNAHKT